MKKGLLIVCCGGTIDKEYATGVGVTELHMGRPYIKEFLEKSKLGANFDFQFSYPVQKDSTEMGAQDREFVVDACRRYPTLPVIISHGTDTMHKTARSLVNYGVVGARPIVLTGASTPGRMKDSNADFDIGMAVAAACGYGPGVFIAMHGVHNWDECVKNSYGVFVRKMPD